MDYEMFQKRLGAEIKRRRGEKNPKMTQIDLASKASTDQGSISRLENGKQGLDMPLALRVATALGTDFGELVYSVFHPVKSKGFDPESALVAQKWARLTPKEKDTIGQIIDMALNRADDARVAQHIKPAPDSPGTQDLVTATGRRRRR